MGVGKTAVSRQLIENLPNCVFLDGDWCWDSNPFVCSEETKKMVIENICFMLNQFIKCSAYENIVFCWAMHEQYIIDSILERIDKTNCDLKLISLICNEDTLRERLEEDIQTGVRTRDVIARSVARISLYEKLRTMKIQTDGRSIEELVSEIEGL